MVILARKTAEARARTGEIGGGWIVEGGDQPPHPLPCPGGERVCVLEGGQLAGRIAGRANTPRVQVAE